MMPFNMNPQQMAQRILQNNPQAQQYFQNNPQAQQYLQILLDGDAQRGQELAQNLCKSYGISPEQGIQQAQQFVQQNMNNMKKMGFF